MFGFLEEVNDIDKAEYDLISASIFVLANVPYQLQTFTPLIIIIGLMLAFGKLINNNELLAMRSYGFAYSKIIKTTLIISISLIIGISLLSELFAFDLNRWAQNYKNQQLGKLQDTTINHWIYEPKYGFLHIISSRGQHKLDYYAFTNQQLTDITTTDKVNFFSNHLQIRRGKKTQTSPTIKQENITNLTLGIKLPLKILKHLEQEANSLDIYQIWQQINYLKQQSLPYQNPLIIFYQRLIKPILLVIMVLLGIYLTINKNQQNKLYSQILLAIIWALLLGIITRLSEQLILIFNLNAFIIIFTPIILLLLIMTVLLNYRLKNV